MCLAKANREYWRSINLVSIALYLKQKSQEKSHLILFLATNLPKWCNISLKNCSTLLQFCLRCWLIWRVLKMDANIFIYLQNKWAPTSSFATRRVRHCWTWRPGYPLGEGATGHLQTHVWRTSCENPSRWSPGQLPVLRPWRATGSSMGTNQGGGNINTKHAKTLL